MITIQLDDKELDNELIRFMKNKGITSEMDAWVSTNIRNGLKSHLKDKFYELLKDKYGKNDIEIGVSGPRVRVRLSKISDVKDTRDNKYWFKVKEDEDL